MIEHLLTPLITTSFLEDEHYRNGHLRVINPLDDAKVLSVHIPKLKKLARDLSTRADATELISAFEREFARAVLCFEEKIVWELMINYISICATEISPFNGLCPCDGQLGRL